MSLDTVYKKFPTAIDTRNKIPTRIQQVNNRTEYFLNLFEENIGYSVTIKQYSTEFDLKINDDIDHDALQQAVTLLCNKGYHVETIPICVTQTIPCTKNYYLKETRYQITIDWTY